MFFYHFQRRFNSIKRLRPAFDNQAPARTTVFFVNSDVRSEPRNGPVEVTADDKVAVVHAMVEEDARVTHPAGNRGLSHSDHSSFLALSDRAPFVASYNFAVPLLQSRESLFFGGYLNNASRLDMFSFLSTYLITLHHYKYDLCLSIYVFFNKKGRSVK